MQHKILLCEHHSTSDLWTTRPLNELRPHSLIPLNLFDKPEWVPWPWTGELLSIEVGFTGPPKTSGAPWTPPGGTWSMRHLTVNPLT